MLNLELHDLDNQRFEGYLKRFRPLGPEPLPLAEVSQREIHRTPAVAVWAAAVAMILAGLVLTMPRVPTNPSSGITFNPGGVEPTSPSRALTVREANAFLLGAPSFKTGLDDMSWRSHTSKMPEGQQSALTVLGKENFKL